MILDIDDQPSYRSARARIKPFFLPWAPPAPRDCTYWLLYIPPAAGRLDCLVSGCMEGRARREGKSFNFPVPDLAGRGGR